MPHPTPLISTLVGAFVLAFVFGAAAQRLRISPIVGYLLAGIAVGPFTPGFVADQELAGELAEIGVILLMFGVGLHFSPRELLAVKAIAIPGAIAQIAVATALGMALAWSLGWTLAAGVVFGLALSVASTVVLLRALQERHLLQTARGHIAVGWLIVEDLAMVLVLVLLPVLAEFTVGGGAVSASQVATSLLATAAKIAAFVAIMLLVGRRLIPRILHYVAWTGSRELFRLAVLAVSLGVAYGAALLFGVSFALGAFFSGIVLAESELSQRATEESLPFRDAFAVLFFVSVGMLVDPSIVWRDPWPLLATFLIITLGKSGIGYLIVRAFGHSAGTALTIAASLAQIGEFSFILVGLGVALQVLPEEGRDLVLAGAILSILLNPTMFFLVDRLRSRAERRSAATMPEPAADTSRPPAPTRLRDHFVLVGYGRVGGVIGEEIRGRGLPLFVIDQNQQIVDRAQAQGVEAVLGEGLPGELLTAANIAAARALFVAIPNGFEAGQFVTQARTAQPALKIVARAHSDDEVEHLRQLGADQVILGERETALGMLAAMFDNPVAPPAAAAIAAASGG
jgi:CPA2 family monovalent cation:H+ antiporter-2